MVLEESPQLSDGAIAAIVLIVLVTVISIVVLLVIAVAFVRQRSQRKKYSLDKAADTSRATNTYQAVNLSYSEPVDDEQPLDKSDICLQEKLDSLPIAEPSTEYIESNPDALEDNQEVQESDDNADNAVKDTSMWTEYGNGCQLIACCSVELDILDAPAMQNFFLLDTHVSAIIVT